MRARLVILVALTVWCCGCATMVSEDATPGQRQADAARRPVIIGTAPGGSTRYHGAGQIVENDNLTVLAVDGRTRLQIGYGKQAAYIDLDDAARLRLAGDLRNTLALCDSAKQGSVKGVVIIDSILGQSGYTAASRGLLEIAFSVMVLKDGGISCADILALKKSEGPVESQQASDFTVVHAVAFASLLHLIDVLEQAPNPARAR